MLYLLGMQPHIYPKGSHSISKKDIDKDALYVLETLNKHGFTAYLVGGSVRDLLLGHKPKDYDISTSAKPEEVKSIFKNCLLIGRRFRLAHVRFGPKIIEVATFRAGDTDTNALIIRDNTWGNEEEDVMRRDFTINGLFYDAANESIIDYVGGYKDIQKQILRVIGTPHARFRQDPVRMLRLIKFRARLAFTIEESAMQAMLECRPEILKSSSARVLEEVLRMLESGHAETFFRYLADAGMLTHLLPVLAEFIEKDHKKEIFSFLHIIDQLEEMKERPVLLSCLLFPLFSRHIAILSDKGSRRMHLGVIQDEAFFIVNEFFSPFFVMPRKLKTDIASILTSQYRLTPLERVKGRFFRIPRVADFDQALSFFQLRADMEPGLQDLCSRWHSAYQSQEKKHNHL
ncbi:MAG: polynucleotide adenylyltransferase PcnB [Chlamydiae bacterium]|nr:polynucleotide adenylyltransferase PcnB [Chlamydiota bacterium]